jgi:hypothetical protein
MAAGVDWWPLKRRSNPNPIWDDVEVFEPVTIADRQMIISRWPDGAYYLEERGYFPRRVGETELEVCCWLHAESTGQAPARKQLPPDWEEDELGVGIPDPD